MGGLNRVWSRSQQGLLDAPPVPDRMSSRPVRAIIPLVLLTGGVAAIGWQLIWSHHLTLALGASAKGVALTVATTMAGMTAGALAMARWLRGRPAFRALRGYGLLEAAMAVTALLPGWLQDAVMNADTWIYQQQPALGTPFTVLALAMTLGPATMAMGATLPVIGLLARESERPLSRLYALNTAGAGLGCLLAAFLLLPGLGLSGTAGSLSLTHGLLAGVCLMLSIGVKPAIAESAAVFMSPLPPNPPMAPALALISGTAAFILEVAWFRELRAAWFTTSDSFAVMLFCFLVALAGGAALAAIRQGRGVPLWIALTGAGVLSLAATQALVHFDRIDAFHERGVTRIFSRTLGGLLVMGPPVLLLGTILPSLLDRAKGPREWARLYATNTLGAIIGANLAAWVLFEWIGPVPTAWTASALLGAGVFLTGAPRRTTQWIAAALLAGLSLTVWSHRGDWKRIPGSGRGAEHPGRLVEQRHGPEASVAVAEFPETRVLYIDGFATTAESASGKSPLFHYMEAMGRLPMRAHPAARDALVICLGTGQTADAVRAENPEHLVIADLSEAVFDLAGHFRSNHGVLDDPRVEKVVMDGRAWLRRSDRRYDVITMEPMPPFFSGSNTLYSVGFYELVASRLNEGGIFAQWFPLHLMTPEQARAIAAAFVAVFPDAVIWFDPNSTYIAGLPDQGILLGRHGGKSDGIWWEPLRELRTDPRNPAPPSMIDPADLHRFVAGAEPVTDDNLLLEYGPNAYGVPDRSIAATIRQIHEELTKADAP